MHNTYSCVEQEQTFGVETDEYNEIMAGTTSTA
jgi:hypothetical protein